MKMNRLIRFFSPSIAVGVIVSLFLGYGYLSQQLRAELKGGQVREVDPSQGTTDVIAVDDDGHVFLFGNRLLVKYGLDGDVRWAHSFDRLRSLPSMTINGIAADIDGDILAVGVSFEKHLATVYEIDGKSGRITLFGQYPGLEPSYLSVAPDGKVYLSAFSARGLNELIFDPGLLPDRYLEPVIHEIRRHDEIVRSLHTIVITPQSVQDLADKLVDAISRRLVFSPGGTAYLVDRHELALHEMDLESGRVTGRLLRLSMAGASNHVSLRNLFFLDESVVLYSLTHLGPAVRLDARGRPVYASIDRWEVRSSDLDNGLSIQVSAGPANDLQVGLLTQFSRQIHLVGTLGPSLSQTQDRGYAETLVVRLREMSQTHE